MSTPISHGAEDAQSARTSVDDGLAETPEQAVRAEARQSPPQQLLAMPGEQPQPQQAPVVPHWRRAPEQHNLL